jgi:3-hydroxyisobutyrate dehydrogenase
MQQITNGARIGFVGIGVMGRGMATNLAKAGFQISIYNRTKSKVEDLISSGFKWHDRVSDLVVACDVIISMVGYPQDVEEVYLGEGGIIAHAAPGTILIDMTTSSPVLAQRIDAEAESKGLYSLDAPVSGGDIGARNGTLSIMVGGMEEVFRAAYPVLEAMGENIVYQGGAGAGQHTKMCNQIAIASTMMGVCEAILYADRAGLSMENVLQSIAKGAAGSWSLSNLAPRIIKGDYAPGFFVKHFIKDMTIALESAEQMGLLTPGLKLAKSLYKELASKGDENSGTQALYKLLDLKSQPSNPQ